MILTTTKEARLLDQRVMEDYGLPEAVLMENAGASVIRLMSQRFSWNGRYAVIVCGTGNNGGDGFVAARYAVLAGADVIILLMGNEAHMGPSASLFRKEAEKEGIPVISLQKAEEAIPYFERADVIIDALIGTGLQKAVAGEKAGLIEEINDSDAIVISVDVPSGMISDNGQAKGAVVEADYTIALGSLKRGHVLYPGSDWCGEVLFSSIGMPDQARQGFPVHYAAAEDVMNRLPVRNRISHKGKNGFIGIFAGSEGMAGAGLLAARGALYAGSGKVALNTLEKPAKELTGIVPEVMVSAAGKAPYFKEEMAEHCIEEAKKYMAVAIGPGLGRAETTQRFVISLLQSLTQTVVVDADALYAVSKLGMDWPEAKGHFILTPHVGEFSMLTGLSPKEIEENRIEAARDFAMKHKVCLVLKGAPTVTALPMGFAWVNSTGNPGMATGGMGDTLTGIIVSLAGQGMQPADAAMAGVYLHGLAGDLIAKKTPVGYLASDLAMQLPKARKLVMTGKWKDTL